MAKRMTPDSAHLAVISMAKRNHACKEPMTGELLLAAALQFEFVLGCAVLLLLSKNTKCEYCRLCVAMLSSA